MKHFFSPNIDGRGRIVRAAYGGLMVVLGGYLGLADSPWLGLVALLAGGFAWFEAARGWCVLRACGVKTRW